VTAAGIPLVAIGHNDHVAWGYTSGLSDVDSLYAEQTTGAESYRFRGAERQMECRDETFSYRSPPTDLLTLTDLLEGGTPATPGAGSRTERICRTVHGPVEVRAGEVAYARRYATWMRELETINGLVALSEARSVRDVDAAMRQVTWNENVMAADDQGNIGYWHPGLHPLRPRGWDERLPYPGTGEAEWRGLLDRKRTPRVINPKRGWLANWNNVPSVGWTSGDGEARERQTGAFHRVGWLNWLVRSLRRKPTWERARSTIEREGSFAQQRPLASARLRRARRGASGDAATVLDALLRWDGSYVRVDADGTVDPGVAIWEQFKDEAERIAADRLGGGFDASKDVRGEPGSSHQFDISLGEAYGLRTLSPAGLRQAAAATFAALSKQFGTDDVAKWREERRMYEVSAQGAASAPDLPFFDRGTWEQLVEVGP
jgi:penicillin amidase